MTVLTILCSSGSLDSSGHVARTWLSMIPAVIGASASATDEKTRTIHEGKIVNEWKLFKAYSIPARLHNKRYMRIVNGLYIVLVTCGGGGQFG